MIATVLFGDQILDAEVAFLGQDLGAPVVAVLLADLAQLGDDDLHQELVAGENGTQPLDQRQHFGQLVEDLLPLEPGQALELHVEDGLRLDLAEAELRHQAAAGLDRIPRRADERDHRVEVVERDLQALEDVGARFGLAQLELRCAAAPPRAGTR